MFLKIFHKRVRFHTLIFVILNIALFISFLLVNTIPENDRTQWQTDLVVILTLIFILGYLILFGLSGIKMVSENLFKQRNYIFNILASILAFGMSTALVLAYRNVISPGLTVELFKFETIFSAILSLIFFGWNIIQIFYIRISLKKWSVKTEEFYQKQIEKSSMESKKKVLFTTGLNALILAISAIMLLVLGILFRNSTNKKVQVDGNGEFDPTFPLHPANNGLIAIIVAMTCVILFTIYLEVRLYGEARRNSKSNLYTGVFFLLFWMIMIIKVILLMNSYVKIVRSVSDTENLDIFNIIVDVVLMLMTIFNLLRKFGSKLDLDDSEKQSKIINEYNVSFIMFLFVFSYFGGQLTILSSGIFSNKAQLSFATNLIVIIVNLGFYYYYSAWDLEQIGYIRKTRYTRPEVKEILLGLSNSVYEGLESSIGVENDTILLNSLNSYLLNQEIIFKEGKGISGPYLNLDGEEKVSARIMKDEIEVEKEEDIKEESQSETVSDSVAETVPESVSTTESDSNSEGDIDSDLKP